MFIADLVISLVMLIVLVRAARAIYDADRQTRFDTPLPTRDIVALLAVLTASSAVRVWGDSATTSGWVMLAANVIALSTVMMVVQRRRRRQVAWAAEWRESRHAESVAASDDAASTCV